MYTYWGRVSNGRVGHLVLQACFKACVWLHFKFGENCQKDDQKQTCDMFLRKERKNGFYSKPWKWRATKKLNSVMRGGKPKLWTVTSHPRGAPENFWRPGIWPHGFVRCSQHLSLVRRRSLDPFGWICGHFTSCWRGFESLVFVVCSSSTGMLEILNS